MLGNTDLAVSLADLMYSENNASNHGSPSHPYVLSDMDYEEGELPLFDEETDRMDHKWNKKIVNWDEVHTLLRYSFCVPLDANSMFVALTRTFLLKYTVL